MHLQNFLFSKFSLFDTLKYKKMNKMTTNKEGKSKLSYSLH